MLGSAVIQKIGHLVFEVGVIIFSVAGLLFALWMLGFGLSPNEVTDDVPPERETIPTVPAAPTADPAWSCDWSPTMNEDWHDDVLCSRGAETIRPTLMPDSSFVTSDEIMQAAYEYEATLNG